MNRTDLATFAFAGALSLATLGCVSSATYREAVGERNALAQRKAQLEQELRALEQKEQQLAVELAAKNAELSGTRGTYDALIEDLKSELASGQVQIEQLRDGIRVQLAQEILFPSGSAELDPQGADVLARVAKQVLGSGHRVEVLGHTDDVPIKPSLAPRFPTNWELAAARASRVVRLFQDAGLEGGRLRAVSRAEYEPVASNDSPQNREKNRRIEVRLLPAGASNGTAAATDASAPASAPEL